MTFSSLTRRRHRWLILAVLLLFTVWQTTACNSGNGIRTSTVGEQSDCRQVDHFAGTTCVPNQIERLVTLDSVAYEYAIALGLQPIGTVSSEFSASLIEQTEQVANIGQTGEPNLESVLALEPDLILGLDFHESLYAQASQIAPTVLLQFEHSGQWKDVFQKFSTVVNQEAMAAEVMDKYQQRLAEFKRRLAASATSLPQVSIVRVYPDSINLYLRDSFPGTVLQDAGLPRPVAQDISATEAQSIANNPIQISISRELLAQADADVIFLWTGENTPEAKEQAEQRLTQLKADPLWQQLKAIQQNQIYQVPSYWIGSGPIAANAVVDDLFKFILEEK